VVNVAFVRLTHCCSLVFFLSFASFDFPRLPQYDDNNQKALLRRGLAFEGLERFQLGLTDIRKLLLANPNVAMANKAQHRLQNALRQQRKMKEAMKKK
jgi:hypothetical protein